MDKTGTLTENRMTVVRLYVAGDNFRIDAAVVEELPEIYHALVEFSILASKIDPFDPMEQAFVHLGERFLKNTEHLHRDWMLAHEYGLTPELRTMALVWKARDNNAAYVIAAKGSPEAIVDLCHLDAAAQDDITGAVEAMAAEGWRVLAVARAAVCRCRFPSYGRRHCSPSRI